VIFADDRDRRRWMELVAEAVAVFNLVVHGYVLMDNHYHLMVETREANLSRAMQWLQTSYSMGFNRRHRRVGPLFQGRFKAIVVEHWNIGVRSQHSTMRIDLAGAAWWTTTPWPDHCGWNGLARGIT